MSRFCAALNVLKCVLAKKPSRIKKFEKQHKRNIKGIRPETLELLKKYNWPGNIRELENAIERAFIVESGQTIQLSSLPDHIRQPSVSSQPISSAQDRTLAGASLGYSGPLDFDAFKEEMEKEFIISALKANSGKINQTVALANIPKNTLLRKIRKYGINVKDYSED